MGKVILYIATTLDGFIAKTDGSLDWLNSIPSPEEGDYGYAALLENIEVILMGRKTYDEVLGFGITWPYEKFNTYVLTKDNSFAVSTPNTHVVNTNIDEFISKLKQKTIKNIWLVGGGQTITEFLNKELLDKMILTIVPRILGNGIALFPNKPKESIWKLTQVESFTTGLVNLTYEKM